MNFCFKLKHIVPRYGSILKSFFLGMVQITFLMVIWVTLLSRNEKEISFSVLDINLCIYAVYSKVGGVL